MTNGWCDLERLEYQKGIRTLPSPRVIIYYGGFWLCPGHKRQAIVDQLVAAKFPYSPIPQVLANQMEKKLSAIKMPKKVTANRATEVEFRGSHIHNIVKGECTICHMTQVAIMAVECPDEPEDEVTEPRYDKSDLD